MRTPAKLVMTAAVLVGMSAVATGGGTHAAISGTTQNTGNSFKAGSVTLDDNDGGTPTTVGVPMFNTTGMRPSEDPANDQVGCIQVTYTGSIPVPVRVHAATTTTGTIHNNLLLTVERGTQTTPAFDSCVGFTPDPAVYVTGQPNGVVYTGTLAAFPTNYAAANPLPTTPWVTGEKHVYRVTVRLPSSTPTTVQNQTATTSFTWEGQT